MNPPPVAAPHVRAPAPHGPQGAPAVAGQRPLVRLPLQIGTSATWNATAAALTLLPSVAFTLPPVAYLGAAGLIVSAFVGLTLTLPFVIYAVASLVRARRNRASDLVLDGAGVLVVGGPMHGRRMGWNDLAPPFAAVERTTEKRFRLGWLLAGAAMFLLFLAVLALMIAAKDASTGVFDLFGTPWKRKEIDLHRLWIVTARGPILAATTERETEAASMHAAAESIQAVVTGQRYVRQAPAVAAQVVTCPACGAPAVPEDAPAVRCAYCANPVPMPPYARQQAAATRAAGASRVTAERIVAKLLRQPSASSVNARLALFTTLMFLVWPVAWAVVVPRVVADGWDLFDVPVLVLPLFAGLAWSFLARAGLADRGALQLLTLGFGALAPAREGDPPRCRRCQGPLPPTEVGGVVACRYCAADNVVGVDLRPIVGPARAEQATLERAIEKRSSERWKWGLLSGVAGAVLAVWVVTTAGYLVRNLAPEPAPPPATPRR